MSRTTETGPGVANFSMMRSMVFSPRRVVGLALTHPQSPDVLTPS
jgi:hypothetical protein